MLREKQLQKDLQLVYLCKHVKLAKQHYTLFRDTYIHKEHKNTDEKAINQFQDSS